jgi:extradiol dioxygenase family protein
MSITNSLEATNERPTQCEGATTTALSKFHLSLNVHDLPATAAFLELLLGRKPTQLHSDYAKFELADPPVVLSLAPTDAPTNSGLNHLGFRLPTRQALVALQQRLAEADVSFDVEESVACCHSRQIKFWVQDPPGNLWEFYVLEEPETCDSTPLVAAPRIADSPSIPPGTARWDHRLGQPLPLRIAADTGTLDQVVLEGTFNAQPASGQPALILREASRVLRPGGSLLMHGVTGDRPLTHPPELPGPAAAVKYVPTTAELLDAVKDAGLVGSELITFGETYHFMHAGAELRETRLRAWRADAMPEQVNLIVIYRGPFAEVRDDSGLIFRRGEATCVDAPTIERLRQSSGAASFAFLPSSHQTHDGSCGNQK